MNDQEAYIHAINRLKNTISIIKVYDFSPITKSLSVLRDVVRLKSDLPVLDAFCSFAEHVVGWIPLNPNKVDRIRAIISTYHLPGYDNFIPEMSSIEHPHPISEEYTGKLVAYSESNILPTRNGFITLYRSIKNNIYQYIGIQGRRGSGKTMALNYFLTTAHTALCKEGIVWFRTDVAKLWLYQQKEFNLSVAQYTMLHSVYVGLRYSDDDPNLRWLNNNGQMFTDYLHNRVTSKIIEKEIYDLWRNLVRVYIKVLGRASNNKSAKPIMEFIKQGCYYSEKIGQFYLQEVYLEMLSFLRDCAKKENRELQILIILDGVDNIRVGAEQEKYFLLLEEIIVLFTNTTIMVGDKFLLVARPETFIDMQYLTTKMTHTPDAPLMFNLDADIVSDVLKKKSIAIGNPVEYFHDAAVMCTGNKYIDTKQSRLFEESIKCLLLIFKRAAFKTDNKSFENEKPIDLIFDGNIRSLLRNTIRSHNYRLRLEYAKVSKYRSLLEGSVLAGCNSMPDNQADYIHGHWCPNLFEYATIDENGRWTGLVMIRLLQLFVAVKEGVSREDAVSFLEKMFGYGKLQCEKAFQAAAEYSLIKCVNHKDIGFDEKIVRTIKTRLYSATPKGKYLLTLVFENNSIFYFMAASSPLDLDRLISKKVDIQLLSHSIENDRHFFRAVILSGILMWGHIMSADRREQFALRKRLTIVDKGENISPDAFALPSINIWQKNAEIMLRKLSKNEQLEVIEVLEKYTLYLN